MRRSAGAGWPVDDGDDAGWAAAVAANDPAISAVAEMMASGRSNAAICKYFPPICMAACRGLPVPVWKNAASCQKLMARCKSVGQVVARIARRSQRRRRAAAAAATLFERLEIGDHVLALLLVLQAGEYHLGAGDILARIGEI